MASGGQDGGRKGGLSIEAWLDRAASALDLDAPPWP